jgi:hypothetical protein
MDAPLHPRRIKAALHWLADEDYASRIEGQTLETCLAALKLVSKGQQATGLTPEVADLGKNVLGVLDYVKKGITGR